MKRICMLLLASASSVGFGIWLGIDGIDTKAAGEIAGGFQVVGLLGILLAVTLWRDRS
jgi:hypothetical protein